MAERICGSCGAINHAGAHVCWRCLVSFDERTERAADAPEPAAEPRPATR